MSALERSRDRLMQQLLDTVALLGQLQAEAARRSRERRSWKQRLGKELELRQEAMQEVEQPSQWQGGEPVAVSAVAGRALAHCYAHCSRYRSPLAHDLVQDPLRVAPCPTPPDSRGR